MTTEKRPSTSILLGGNAFEKDGKKIKELVRFSHLNVFAWKLNKESGKEQASVEVWIPKEHTHDVKLLRDAIAEQTALYKKAFGEPGPKFWNPMQDGDTRVDQKGKPKTVPGHYVISAKVLRFQRDGTENTLPEVRGIMKDAQGKLVKLSSAHAKSGDYGRISLNLACYDKSAGGVGAYINFLQKVRDGEPLGNRRSADDELAGYDDDEDDIDPLS